MINFVSFAYARSWEIVDTDEWYYGMFSAIRHTVSLTVRGTRCRSTTGQGKVYESVLETIGNTPAIKINRLGPSSVC